MRNLASIQKIISLSPIKGKDRIEVAEVLGWNVIVMKGVHKVGELCVFIEPDSLLPIKPEFEFLRSRCYLPKLDKFRIRSMKMAGIYSQGIVFPLNILEKGEYKEDENVTSKLEIEKYDPELKVEQRIHNKKPKGFFKQIKWFLFDRYKKANRKFPVHLIEKSDETRVQNLSNILENIKGVTCVMTEKIEGQSGTYILNNNKFTVCSRNLIRTEKLSNWWKVANKFELKNKLKILAKKLGIKNVAIQGEIIGPGIQGNIYNRDELDFYIFSIYDIDHKKYIPWKTYINVIDSINLKYCPFVGIIELEGQTPQEFLGLAKGKSVLNNKTDREGIVIRDICCENNSIAKIGSFLSFKAINPDYVLKSNL